MNKYQFELLDKRSRDSKVYWGGESFCTLDDVKQALISCYADRSTRPYDYPATLTIDILLEDTGFELSVFEVVRLV